MMPSQHGAKQGFPCNHRYSQAGAVEVCFVIRGVKVGTGGEVVNGCLVGAKVEKEVAVEFIVGLESQAASARQSKINIKTSRTNVFSPVFGYFLHFGCNAAATSIITVRSVFRLYLTPGIFKLASEKIVSLFLKRYSPLPERRRPHQSGPFLSPHRKENGTPC